MRKLSCSMILMAFLSLSARAVPLPNPLPAAFFDDIDGTGYFDPFRLVFDVKVADLGEVLAIGSNTFGFFFKGGDVTDSSNLITIFSPLDEVGATAAIDFNLGIVVDTDESVPVIESLFTGSGDIGFFLTLSTFGGTTVFSDASLNLGGTDVFGAFPSIAFPATFGLSFVSPGGVLVGFEIVSGVIAVPVPATALLMLSGLIGLGAFRIRSRKSD